MAGICGLCGKTRFFASAREIEIFATDHFAGFSTQSAHWGRALRRLCSAIPQAVTGTSWAVAGRKPLSGIFIGI
jgi:hypothetical protein